jgi:hypothetical protein
MKTAKIDLSPLLEFARRDPGGLGLQSKNLEGKNYSKLASNLLNASLDNNFNQLPGFYFWIDDSCQDESKVIYVGKSNNLKRRLLENLKHSRIAFWKDIHGLKSEWIDAAKANSPEMWRIYQNHWKKAESRSGATSILWVGDYALQHVRLELIEGWLITQCNPRTNTQNKNDYSYEYKSLNGRSKQIIDGWSDRISKALIAHQIIKSSSNLA